MAPQSQPADIEARRAQLYVQRVPLTALEPAALHAVVLLGVADQRLDGLAPPEPALVLLTRDSGMTDLKRAVRGRYSEDFDMRNRDRVFGPF